MKRFLSPFIFLAAAAFFPISNAARAQDDSGDDQGASFQTFYDQLGGDQGTWVQTDDYGYVFQPNVTDPNWAPYTDGQWVYTDEGWTWVSNEPWGWATYHYGRWANIDGMGWVWVPGYRWGPAWVSWRYGGGYVGWAPLPPDADYDDQDNDYHFGGDVDVSFDIGPGCYNFVPIADIGAPDCGRVIINRYRNYSLINRTTNITNINVSRNGGGGGNGFAGIAANGPPINEINAHASRPVPTVQLSAAVDPGRSSIQGNTLDIFAPRVNAATARQARPASVVRNIGNPTLNRGNSITHPLAVTATVHPAAPSADLIQQATQAQAHVPASAKIATSHTQPPPVHSFQQATTIHPAANPGEPQHTVNNAPQTFHPENQGGGEPQRTVVNPQQTFHPENQGGGEPQRTVVNPQQTFHPEDQGGGEPQRTEVHPAPAPRPQNQGGSQPQHAENKPENVPHASSSQGNSHPSGGAPANSNPKPGP